MQKIKNLKTEKSEKQIIDEWSTVEANRCYYLTSTDWTQLPDVHLKNREEFVQWRNKVRTLQIHDFSSPIEANNFLKTFESERPKAQFEEYKPINKNSDDPRIEALDKKLDEQNVLVHQLINHMLETEKDAREEDIASIDRAESIEIILGKLTDEHHKEMIDMGALTFPLKLSQVEQALDFLASDNESSVATYSLLDNETDGSDAEYAEKLIEDYKQYLKTLSVIDKRYADRCGSVYNMTTQDINDWFHSHGYRYRCSEQGKP